MVLSRRRAACVTALVCATPIVSHSIGRSVYGLLLPAIKADLGLSNGQAGLPGSGIFISYVIGVLFVVFGSPRLEPITIMRGALAISVVGAAAAATASELVQLTIGLSLVGGAGAGIWMTAPVLATEYVRRERRGLIIGALTSTIGVANIAFGVGTGLWRRAAGDDDLWRPVWWAALAFTALLLAGLVTVARFSRTERITAGTLGLRVITSIPRWRSITVAYALFGGMTAGFGTFVVAALEDHGGLSESSSPVVFALMGVAGMLASPLAGALSDRVGRITVLRFALVVLVTANVSVAVGTTISVIAGALLYSAGASTFPALIATYVRDSLDNRAFSQALAIMTIMFSLMAALLPAVVGRVADTSFAVAYLVLAILPLAALVALAGASRSDVRV